MRLTTGRGDKGSYGDRTPAMFLSPENKMYFVSAVNGDGDYDFKVTEAIKLNQKYHIEIHQRYISQGNYRFFMKIDRVEVHSIVNNDARQFYDVKVYASDQYFDAIGFISNLHLTNFL